MSDPALKNAEIRRDALAAQINSALQQVDEWKRELRGVEQFIAAWHSFASMLSREDGLPTALVSALAPASESAVGDAHSGKPSARNSRKEEVAEAALGVIREHGAPVSRSDLYNELVARGLRIGGTDPEMVLSTMLWRMKDLIVRIPKFGYWPRDKKFEPAGYDPSVSSGDQEHSDMATVYPKSARHEAD